MKIVWVAVVGLGVGIGAGTGVSALRTKAEILGAHEQARADSLAAHPRSGAYEDDGAVTVVLPPDEGPAGDSLGAEAALPADSSAAPQGDSTSSPEPDATPRDGSAKSAPAAVEAAPDSAAGTSAEGAADGQGRSVP